MIDALAEIAPTLAVRGNIDVRAKDLPDLMTIDLVEENEQLLTILLMHIAVNGPRLRADAIRAAKKNHANLVICGQSHVPFIGRDQGTSVFNPGSMGPRRISIADRVRRFGAQGSQGHDEAHRLRDRRAMAPLKTAILFRE